MRPLAYCKISIVRELILFVLTNIFGDEKNPAIAILSVETENVDSEMFVKY